MSKKKNIILPNLLLITDLRTDQNSSRTKKIEQLLSICFWFPAIVKLGLQHMEMKNGKTYGMKNGEVRTWRLPLEDAGCILVYVIYFRPELASRSVFLLQFESVS